MPKVHQARRRWGWASAGDVRRVNRIGDTSVRVGCVGIGVLFLGMMLALLLGESTSTKLATLGIAALAGSVFALAGFLLALAGLRKAGSEKRSTRSSGWGLVLALLLLASVLVVELLTVWVRR